MIAVTIDAAANFNPLAPGGARQDAIEIIEYSVDISIHSPRVGRGGDALPDGDA